MLATRNKRAAPRQVVFLRADAFYHSDGRISEIVSLAGLGFALPSGMHAHYNVVTYADGSIGVAGVKQARSKHGKHSYTYTGTDAESKAQAELLKWSARILRERAAELSSGR